MGFSKPTYAVDNIQSLSDTPNATEGLTGAQLRAKFDKTGADGKTYVNALVDELDISVALQNSGWVKDTTTTFSYTSATRIATSIDLTTVLGIGDKIKYKQDTYKYGYVIAVTATYIDVTGGSDYAVANVPITEFYYSHVANPIGFPQWFSYIPTWSNVTLGSGSSVGKFNITNRILTVSASLALAANSSVGGSVSCSVPTAVLPGAGSSSVALLSEGGSPTKIGVTYIASGAAVLILTNIVSGTTIISSTLSATVPFTWGASDSISFTTSYGI